MDCTRFITKNVQKGLLKSKAEKSKDPTIWKQYKNARNEANNAIKQSKF